MKDTMTTAAPHKPDTTLVLLATACASYLSRLDSHVVNISLPSIAAQFDIGTTKASAIVVANLLTSTSALILAGKIGDKIGLVRLFKWGYAISIFSSLACAFAPSFSFLVAARAVQGLGSAILQAMGFAIVAAYMPREKTGRAFATVSTAAALGMLTGAPLGGFITQLLSWRWAFMATPPVAVAAILTLNRALPNQKGADSDGHQLEVSGALSIFAALSALVLGLNAAKYYGWHSPATALSFTAAAIAALLFLHYDKTAARPLFKSAVFKNKVFLHASVAQFFAYMLLTGSNFFFPFYLVLYRGLSTAQAGLCMMVYSVAYIIFAPLAGRMADRVNPPLLCTAGMASGALAALLFPLVLKTGGHAAGLIWLVWLAASYSFTLAPNNAFAMRGNKGTDQGTAAGIYNTMANLGMILGVLFMETAFVWKLPSHQATVQYLSALPRVELAGAFGRAYAAGAVACLFSMALALLMLRDSLKLARRNLQCNQPKTITPLP